MNKPVVLAAAPNSQIDGEKYAHIQLIFDYQYLMGVFWFPVSFLWDVPPTQTPTQKLKNRFLKFSSQEIHPIL